MKKKKLKRMIRELRDTLDATHQKLLESKREASLSAWRRGREFESLERWMAAQAPGLRVRLPPCRHVISEDHPHPNAHSIGYVTSADPLPVYCRCGQYFASYHTPERGETPAEEPLAAACLACNREFSVDPIPLNCRSEFHLSKYHAIIGARLKTTPPDSFPSGGEE